MRLLVPAVAARYWVHRLRGSELRACWSGERVTPGYPPIAAAAATLFASRTLKLVRILPEGEGSPRRTFKCSKYIRVTSKLPTLSRRETRRERAIELCGYACIFYAEWITRRATNGCSSYRIFVRRMPTGNVQTPALFLEGEGFSSGQTRCSKTDAKRQKGAADAAPFYFKPGEGR
jgi:hypothetical protein